MGLFGMFTKLAAGRGYTIAQLEYLADSGDAIAQLALAKCYKEGSGGLSQDYREAVRLFKLSANQGNPAGQCALGFCYLEGRGGLPQDEREAVRLTAQGNPWAEFALTHLGCTS
jgi:TPR repeat protein